MNELRSKIISALNGPIASASSAIFSGRSELVSEELDRLITTVANLILEDRASRLADERQRFVDQAAIAILAANLDLGGDDYTAESCAYTVAEKLWRHRESERQPKPEPHLTMKRYRDVDGQLFDAFEITPEWFDGEHPNPLHVTGVVTDPVKRTVSSQSLPGVTATVGDWLVKPVGADRWQVYRLPFLGGHEEVK